MSTKNFVVVPFNLKLKVPKSKVLYTAWTFLEMSLDSDNYNVNDVINGKIKMTSAERAFQKVILVRDYSKMLPIDYALNIIRLFAPEEIDEDVSDALWKLQVIVEDEDPYEALDKKLCDKVAALFYNDVWPLFETKAEAAYQKEVKKREKQEALQLEHSLAQQARERQLELDKAVRFLEANGATVAFPKKGLPLPNATQATKKPAAKKR